MKPTWVLIEDESEPLKCLVMALLERALEMQEEVEVHVLSFADKPEVLATQLVERLSRRHTFASLGNDLLAFVREHVHIAPDQPRNFDDIQMFVDGCPNENRLVLLDLLLKVSGKEIQSQTLMNDQPEQPKLWNRIADESSGDAAVILYTSAQNINNVTSLCTSRRFDHITGWSITDRTVETARQILLTAEGKWRDLNNPARRMLRSIATAQTRIGSLTPGHPQNWSEVPEDFEFNACFDGDVEDFKGIYYHYCTAEDGNADEVTEAWYHDRERRIERDDSSAAEFLSCERPVRTKVVAKILEECGLHVEPTYDAEFVRLPGSLGAIFLWRLLAFLWALDPPRPKTLFFHVSLKEAILSVPLPDVRCLQAAIMTRAYKDGTSAEAYRRLLICAPPKVTDLDGRSLSLSDDTSEKMKKRIENWQKVVLHKPGPDEPGRGEGHFHPAVQPEFDLSANTIGFRWRFRAYEPAQN